LVLAVGADVNDVTKSEDNGSWQPHERPLTTSGSSDNPNALSVLVVDDDEAVRSSAGDVLRTAGYTVTEAADGIDALKLLTASRFDAMVLDLNMPRHDGVCLLAALSRPPPVVIISASEMDEEARQRYGSTIVKQLSKPAPPEQLLEAVADAVRMGQASCVEVPCGEYLINPQI